MRIADSQASQQNISNGQGKQRGRPGKRLLVGWLLIMALAAVGYGGWQLWFQTRRQPMGTQREMFEGVTYVREVRRTPRPLVIHVVTIDLEAPGIGFLVTPPDSTRDLPLKARKTSAFLSQFGAQLAVNASFFTPWYSNNIFSYYPHVGDPVTVRGLTASRGVLYPHTLPFETPAPTLYLSRENRARFDPPNGPIYNAISGNRMLLRHGEVVPEEKSATDHLEPRTAIGLDRPRRKLILVLVDGRQPHYSEGVRYGELAEILRQYGAYEAMNVDGGGSTTLVAEDKRNGPQVLNCPIDCKIPNRERPVANHLGVFARSK